MVISPVRDEEAYLPRSLESMLSQTVRPDVWVVVDDGSTDGTRELLLTAAAEHPWIQAVTRSDRGARAVGGGVVDAFLTGYEVVCALEFDYVCKLDVDIILPPTYFETVMSRMESDHRLGSASGKAYYLNGAGLRVSERIGDDISVGAVKTYRRACLEQIGGLVRGTMWDGIDCHRARIMGWKAVSWDDAEIAFEHLRPMGSSERGILRGRVRWGRGQYFMGTGPLWMLSSSVYRMSRPPLLAGGLAMLYGYASAAFRQDARLRDEELRRYLHEWHRLSLRRGKGVARELMEQRFAHRWDPEAATPWSSTLPCSSRGPRP